MLSNYQLAGFSLSRKHGLATFVHERLKWTLYDQSPTTSETEWLCVDVDGYKIVNHFATVFIRAGWALSTVLILNKLSIIDYRCNYRLSKYV